MSCCGFIVASTWLIASRTFVLAFTGSPGGRPAMNACVLSGLRPGPSRSRPHAGRWWSPASRISPRTVVLPSRNGSESARSMRRGRPPQSVPFRLRTAESAVSWSSFERRQLMHTHTCQAMIALAHR
jgi:hypothetical protein